MIWKTSTLLTCGRDCCMKYPVIPYLRLESTCLNTVVSEVCKQYNLEIPRKWIKVPTRFGNEVSVKQYWTSDSDNEKLGYILEPVI